jgi:ADP-ribose pyrophosphatase YjhB (NUDIX family)
MDNLAAPQRLNGVGVVVWRGEQFLLIRRGKPPRLGEWSIPGGRQELGETVRETALREIREETGLDIELVSLVDVVDVVRKDDTGRVASHLTLVDFAARWIGGDAVAGDDAMAVGWFTLTDLPSLHLWVETERVIRASYPLARGG